MNAHDKEILAKFGLIVGILTVSGCIFGLVSFPPLALFILIGGILVWGAVSLIAVIFGYIFNGE